MNSQKEIRNRSSKWPHLVVGIIFIGVAYILVSTYMDYARKKGYEEGYEDGMKEAAEKEVSDTMRMVEYTKGKELREENLYESTLEEIQARFSCSSGFDVDGALENVNAELEKYGLEIVMGHVPDSNTWLRVEKIKQ